MTEIENLYAVSVAVAHTWEPVTRAEAKHQCSIEADESYWDEDFNRLIRAARESIERRTNRSIVARSVRLDLPSFPARVIPLPFGPVRSVTHVKYLDSAGTLQTVSPADYTLHDGAVYLLPSASWPAVLSGHPAAVQVTYTTGPATAADVDPIAKALALLLVAHWFRNREAVVTGTIASELPLAAETLFSQMDQGEEFQIFGRNF